MRIPTRGHSEFLRRNLQTALVIRRKALYLSASLMWQPHSDLCFWLHTQPTLAPKFFNFSSDDRLTKNSLSRILRDQLRVIRLPHFARNQGGTIGPRSLPIFDNLVMKLLLSSAGRGCCLVVLKVSLVTTHAAQN